MLCPYLPIVQAYLHSWCSQRAIEPQWLIRHKPPSASASDIPISNSSAIQLPCQRAPKQSIRLARSVTVPLRKSRNLLGAEANGFSPFSVWRERVLDPGLSGG